MERSKKMIVYKTLDEIKKIKKANEIIARLFEDILPKYIKAGISTYELDKYKNSGGNPRNKRL